MADWEVGEYIIYQNGEKYELGRIVSLTEDGAFVCYSEGETAAKTPFDCMHKLVNAYTIMDTFLGGERFNWEQSKQDVTDTNVGDMISKQAAIDLFLAEGMITAAVYVERMPSAQQWILCNERMPGADGTYLVYAPDYKGGSSSSKECHDGVMFSRFKNKKWSVEHGYYTKPNCVKAWMPIPKPYKGGE